MRATIITGLLTLILAALAVPAGATGLDDYLQPHCGVDDHTPVNQILVTYKDEIIQRSAAFAILPDNAENTILVWYLGQLSDTNARTIAEQIVRGGALKFRHSVIGAVSYRPSWDG